MRLKTELYFLKSKNSSSVWWCPIFGGLAGVCRIAVQCSAVSLEFRCLQTHDRSTSVAAAAAVLLYHIAATQRVVMKRNCMLYVYVYVVCRLLLATAVSSWSDATTPSTHGMICNFVHDALKKWHYVWLSSSSSSFICSAKWKHTVE